MYPRTTELTHICMYIYNQVHEAIRADPSPAPKSSFKGDKAYKRPEKLTYVSNTVYVCSSLPLYMYVYTTPVHRHHTIYLLILTYHSYFSIYLYTQDERKARVATKKAAIAAAKGEDMEE